MYFICLFECSFNNGAVEHCMGNSVYSWVMIEDWTDKMFNFVLWYSQNESHHVSRWVPNVPDISWRIHLQSRAAEPFSGHEPTSRPLLHLLITQHLSDGGPAKRTKQRWGLHPVSSACLWLVIQPCIYLISQIFDDIFCGKGFYEQVSSDISHTSNNTISVQ